jgi:hypothetical protein
MAYARHVLSLYSTGVEREFHFDKLKPKAEQWIRSIYSFDITETVNNYFIIVCCTFKQAQALVKAKALEMDLSFKMVAGNVNLFSISGWDDDARCKSSICSTYARLTFVGIVVYAYAFLNWDSRRAYAQLFKLLFSLVEEACREKMQFWHIHKTERSVRTIGVDMCNKQAGGMYMLCIC